MRKFDIITVSTYTTVIISILVSLLVIGASGKHRNITQSSSNRFKDPRVSIQDGSGKQTTAHNFTTEALEGIDQATGLKDDKFGWYTSARGNVFYELCK